MTVTMLIVFVVLLVLGSPVAFALGSGAIVAIANSNFELVTFAHKMVNSISSFSMIAVPLFILAGNLCGETGLAKRLVRFSTALVGHIPGASGLVNVLASIFFGGISGSAVADTAAIGGLMIPAMKEEGYDAEFAGGITIASSTIGILVPPSIPQCLYGLAAGVSIGALFIGGLVPGLAVGVTQMIICYFIAKKRHYPCSEHKASLKEIGAAFKESVWALILPVIIFVGCGFGIATASEVGVVAVIYSLIIGLFVYKDFNIKQLPAIIVRSAVTSSCALLIVGVASVVAWVINMERIPAILITFFTETLNNKVLILFLINLLLFFVGCIMDLVPAMLLFAPILLPVVQAFGIHPITFGCILTINLGIGLLTPPVGNCLFVGAKIAKVDILSLFKAALPFALCNVFCLILAHVWPDFTLWLPRLMGFIR